MSTPQIFPYVPQTITVHLGPPDSDAQNVTVPFIDYIKNVASSEIYPTWDDDALRANILAQISFALNRVYTEFYRSRGKNFDITSSTAIDQKYIHGRNIFESIDRIVNEIFNDYIRRQGNIEPLAAQFCNGTTVTCAGLSQWGSENLARQGYSYLDILYRYYGYDIEIVTDAPIQNIRQSYPGYPIRRGSSGPYVQIVQTMLNRISNAYPAIAKVNPVDGIFGSQTEASVIQFQRIFNLTPDGIVGKATWYRMVSLYTGLLKLSELTSEGQRLYGFDLRYPDAISPGDQGRKVEVMQYLLAIIAEFYVNIPPVQIDGIYGPQTEQAVLAFQQMYGLPQNGVVDETTWNDMFDTFMGIIATSEEASAQIRFVVRPFPGETLTVGSRGADVRYIQQVINFLFLSDMQISPVSADGIYGQETANSVKEIQAQLGLPQTGEVDEATWNGIMDEYERALNSVNTSAEQFPGVTLSKGHRDTIHGVTTRPEES